MALALTLGAGAHGIAAADMTAKMTTAAASEMPMQGGCDGCIGDEHGMSATVCVTFCAGVAGVLPSVAPIAAAGLMTPAASPVSPITGRYTPPDPPPPRPVVLS